MSDTIDDLWLESAKSTIRGMHEIFATCPMSPGVLDVLVRAMWSICELTSAPPDIKIIAPSEAQIAARSMLVRGVWRAQEQAMYEILLKLTCAPPASALPPVSM